MGKKKSKQNKDSTGKGKKNDIFAQNMDSNEKTVLQNLPREGNTLSDHLHIVHKLCECSTQVHMKTACALNRGKYKNKKKIYERFP